MLIAILHSSNSLFSDLPLRSLNSKSEYIYPDRRSGLEMSVFV